ncbi:MAG: SRPBCC family protein [Balneola sp.]
MPAFSVSRDITIDSSPEKIFSFLNNLGTWKEWSPWLIMESGVKVTVADDNKCYEWEGKRVGSGNMKITGEEENNSVHYDLTFLTPWKSEAKVKFILDDDGAQTNVTWTMDSSLPWYMFWMTGMMDSWVGMDYERGLRMLKEYIEEGEIKSKLEWKGESEFSGTKYIGVKTTCSFDEIGEAMQKDFGKIESYIKSHESVATGEAYTIYHKWDMKKKQATYTGCVGVTEAPDDLPSGFVNGEIPATKVYTLRHTGKYDHLGNAWSTMMSMARNKEFKQKKSIHPFEHYITNPQETSEADHITDVIFPVK